MVDDRAINIDTDIPRFVRIRGCINCNVSKEMKKKTGDEYGFDHELVAMCITLGCQSYGHNLSDPFIDPEDVVRVARIRGEDSMMKNARIYCLAIKDAFGKFYDKLGISIDDIIAELDNK